MVALLFQPAHSQTVMVCVLIGALALSYVQVGLVSRDARDASNLLLRGCTLRKTEWVIGVVVFTGEHSAPERH